MNAAIPIAAVLTVSTSPESTLGPALWGRCIRLVAVSLLSLPSRLIQGNLKDFLHHLS